MSLTLAWLRQATLAFSVFLFTAQLHADAIKLSAQSADLTRNPGNIIFDQTGVLVASASAFPPDSYAARLKLAGVTWIALQIDNTGRERDDNISALQKGWADR